MDIGSCDLYLSNQTKFLIHGIMQLVAEEGFVSFFRPRPILTSSGLSFIASSCLCISAQIFWSTPFSARRSLNFHIVVESGTVSVVPRNTLNEIRSAAAFGIVPVHSLKRWSEAFPIQSTPNINQLISKIFDPFVFQTKGKISEVSHNA